MSQAVSVLGFSTRLRMSTRHERGPDRPGYSTLAEKKVQFPPRNPYLFISAAGSDTHCPPLGSEIVDSFIWVQLLLVTY